MIRGIEIAITSLLILLCLSCKTVKTDSQLSSQTVSPPAKPLKLKHLKL